MIWSNQILATSTFRIYDCIQLKKKFKIKSFFNADPALQFIDRLSQKHPGKYFSIVLDVGPGVVVVWISIVALYIVKSLATISPFFFYLFCLLLFIYSFM